MQDASVQQRVAPAISSNAFLAIVAIFPVLFAAALTLLIKASVPFSTIGANTEFASIISPSNNVSVKRNYHVSGTIKSEFPGRHLFVIEQSSDGIYPKAPIQPSAVNWSLDLYTGAPVNKDFRIIVAAVDDADKDLFFKWFKTGENTGQYPGINTVDSLQELSAVTVRVAGE